jgi:hypothetical protein
LSRKDFLSLGVLGGFGWLGLGCSSDAKPGAGGGTGGTSTGGTSGSGGSAGTGGTSGSGGGAGTGGSGGGGSPDARSGGAQEGGAACAMVTVSVSMNHTNGAHSLTIPSADVVAGALKVYNVRGMANHDHFIEVTAADFTTLKAGQTVTKFSCNGADHQFVLSCGTPPMGVAPACGDAAAMNMCGLTETTLCR